MTDKKSTIEAYDRLETLIHRCRNQNDYSQSDMFKDLKLLRNAALNDAPEVVTIQQFNAQMALLAPPNKTLFETLMYLFPNGVKIVE